MYMKTKYAALAVLALGLSSCEDYLETTSPSIVDADFVFSNVELSRAALDGAYEQWRDCAQNKVFGDGLWYAADVVGSDIERHPEKFSNQPGRHYPECLYQNGTYAGTYGLTSYQKEDDAYASLYSVIGKANAIINAIEETPDFNSIVSSAKPSEIGQIYGEAVTLRAIAYRELLKNFGDVPYQEKMGVKAGGLVGRDSVYEAILGQLQKVEPLMYPLGSIPGVAANAKNYMSQTMTQAMIGRIALEAGGYQTRRGDLKRVDINGNSITYETIGAENNGATYGRRSDWQKYYSLAKTYFKKVIDNPGTAQFHLTDPRSTGKKGQIFDNPHQYFFQQMMDDDATYADESIYEYPMQQGGGNDARPYSFGRPSKGGSKAAYPCKGYGQGRIVPAFYYGMFDPKDKRRDVAATVTGSDGKGAETLIPFVPNSKASGGGISLNKWDECRQKSPWVAAQRKSGINGPYMRMAEVLLGYAEACAATGDNGEARTYLAMVRERSFPAGEAKTDEFIASRGSLLEAVIDERGFEFAGEGDRRFTLIRSGFFAQKIKAVKDLTRAMIDGLKANGYYEFENGNVISDVVYTKLVDAASEKGYRLTTQAPDESDPVLFPSWRGQHDDWGSLGLASAPAKSNLAIKGLFDRVSNPDELIADGYEAKNWGADIVANDDEYYKYFFFDYDYVKAPIYLWPFTPNIMSAGGFTNGYGFAQK